MIGKSMIQEKPIPLTEVKGILQKRQEKGELTYEQKVSLEYADEFGKIPKKKAAEVIKTLTDDGIDEKLAVRIIDVAPQTKEQVALIFEKARYDLKPAQLKKILDLSAELK